MDSIDLIQKGYLEELHRQTAGDTEVQVSMHELGANIGLDKTEAGSLGEQLIVLGLAELRTLAGGISITPEGLAALGLSVPTSNEKGDNQQLSNGPIAGNADRQMVEQLIKEIKDELSGLNLEYEMLEEIILDLKTIEIHLLSPKPKIGVLVELFRSLQNVFEAAKASKIADRLKSVIGKK